MHHQHEQPDLRRNATSIGDITSTLAVVGAVTGPIGAVLGWITFWRDRPRLKVELIWDQLPFGNTGFAPGTSLAYVRIANIGRRPIYFSHVHIEPQEVGGAHTLLTSGIKGQSLAEGSEPHVVPVKQQGLDDLFAANWWRVRAAVIDSSGQIYRSRWVVRKPSFATEEAPPLALVLARLSNWLADHLPR